MPLLLRRLSHHIRTTHTPAITMRNCAARGLGRHGFWQITGKTSLAPDANMTRTRTAAGQGRRDCGRSPCETASGINPYHNLAATAARNCVRCSSLATVDRQVMLLKLPYAVLHPPAASCDTAILTTARSNLRAPDRPTAQYALSRSSGGLQQEGGRLLRNTPYSYRISGHLGLPCAPGQGSTCNFGPRYEAGGSEFRK
jgi:hypothetical protein